MPRRLSTVLGTVGEQIRLARLRRHITISHLAEAASCSSLTIMRIEKGSPKVSFGAYARVLYSLGLEQDLLLIASADEVGRSIQDAELSNDHKSAAYEKPKDNPFAAGLR